MSLPKAYINCPRCNSSPSYVVRLLECSHLYKYKCTNCNYYFNDDEEFVHPEPSCEMKYITDCCCDFCGVQLIREDNFCRGCGRRIKWNK